MAHAIGLQDLEFAFAVARYRDRDGYLCSRSERIGVPKIPYEVLACTFFLYDTEEEAKAGLNPHGTGVIVEDPSEVADGMHYYGVTNWHVAVQENETEVPSPVVRLNRRGGREPFVKPLRPEDWHFTPGGPDLAVAYFDFLERDDLKWNRVPTGLFATVEHIQSGDVAVGDDSFMMGLFVDHLALATNIPSARFGNISVLPSSLAKIEHATGFESECYVVDMHSRTGFSGSPVFMYRTIGQDLSKPIQSQIRIQSNVMTFGMHGMESPIYAKTVFLFLGIHMGQFPGEWMAGKSPARLAESSKVSAAKTEHYVPSSMTCVIPAWYIRHAIDTLPGLEPMRKIRENELRRREQSRIISEKAPPSKKEDDPNPNHKEDFNALLRAAAQKREQED